MGISWGSENEGEPIEEQQLEGNTELTEFEKFNNSVNYIDDRLKLIKIVISSFEK